MTFNREKFEDYLSEKFHTVWNGLAATMEEAAEPYCHTSVCPSCYAEEHVQTNKTKFLSELKVFTRQCKGNEIMDMVEGVASVRANLIASLVLLEEIDEMTKDLVAPI